MTNRFIGLLLIIAGLVTPMHKDSLSVADWTVMILFLGSGALCLLASFLKKTEQDELYRIQLQFDNLKLFTPSGFPALQVGQQLYVQPYSGALKEDVHILTADGDFVAKMPAEHIQHVVYKVEKHSPIHLVIKSLQMDKQYPVYSIVVEMMA